jgi:ribosomal protein S18 acetylase RimI-like enzyme
MATSPTTVRSLEDGDLDRVNGILDEAFPWTEYDADFAVDASDVADDEAVFVAERAGDVVGFVWVCPRGAFGRSGYVRLLGVAPTAQGSGVGSDLMDAAESFVRDRGIDDVFLLVSEFNDAAREFYVGRGYEHVGTIDGYVQSDVDERLLRKRL